MKCSRSYFFKKKNGKVSVDCRLFLLLAMASGAGEISLFLNDQKMIVERLWGNEHHKRTENRQLPVARCY